MHGSIIATPDELQAYKEALVSMGIEIVNVQGISNIDGEQNYRFEIFFTYYHASQLFCAGQLVKTMQSALKSIESV